MSTLTMSTPATVRLPHSPAVGFAAGLLLPLAPALVAALRYLLPYDGTADAHSIVRDVAARTASQEAVVWLGFAAMLTLPVAAVLAGRACYPAAPRLTTAAELLLVPGYLSLAWLVAGDAILLHGVRHGMDPSATAAMYESLHPAASAGMAVFVVGHVLGTVLLGAAAIRSRVVPLWAGVALVVCQPLHVVAFALLGSPALDAVAWGLNAVAFGMLARTWVTS